MRRLLALSFLAAAAFAAKSASADEPKTYTLPDHETWKVGDVVSRHELDHKVQKKGMRAADGTEISNDTTDERTEFNAVLKVLEVNEEGRYTKAIVYFTKWSKTVGETADKSLEGKHVELSGTGATRVAKVLTPGAEVSPAAIEWLDEQLVKAKAKKEETDAVFHPKKPVAVGESWLPDLAEVQKVFGEKMTFLADKSSAKLTLTGVEGDLASVLMELSLQSGPVDGPAGKMDLKDGGVFSIKVEGKKALQAGVHVQTMKSTGSFKFSVAAGPGADFVFDMTMEGEAQAEAGGEMPELPAAK